MINRKKALEQIYWWTKNYILFAEGVTKKQPTCPHCHKRFYFETELAKDVTAIHENVAAIMVNNGIIVKDEEPLPWVRYHIDLSNNGTSYAENKNEG
jgi:hypothetical protein